MTSQRRFFVSAVRIRLLLLVALYLVTLAMQANPARGQVDVWVDPGHCCQKPGAVGFNGPAPPNEMDLTFDVADWLQGKLFGLGYFTYKTVNHPTSFFEPSERAFIANGTIANDDADQGLSRLLISVHMNSVGDANVKGTETHHSPNKYFAQDTKTKLNDLLAASYIHPAMMSGVNVKFLGCSQDRHIKNNSTLAILNVAKPPAVLLEVCFISNSCQWNYILQSGTQAFVAQEIAAGASQYLNATDAHVDVESMARLRAPESELWNHQSSPSRVDSHSSLVSLQEGFEGAMFPPSGWTTQTSGLALPHAWHRTTDPDDVGSGVGAAYLGSVSPSAINEWLISPVVAIAAPDDAIKFSWAGSKYWSTAINASLSIRQSGTTTWTQLWSLAANEPAADPFIYRERVVDVSAWTGMNVEFGFRVSGANGASFAIDDVAVGDFVPTSTAPNDVCATATELTGVFSVQGVTCYAANDMDPYVAPPAQSCVSDHLAGSDVFFEINAAWGDSLHASLTSEWGGGLYLVDDCLTPVCLTGGYPEDARSAPVVDHRFAPGGTYYLAVDGLQGSCGPFELSGEIVDSPTGVRPGGVPALKLVARPNPAGGPVRLFGSFPSLPGTQSTLEIFDVAGRRLQRFESRADSGELSFVWDHRDDRGRRVASGLYFARLRVGSESVVEKFVILR